MVIALCARRYSIFSHLTYWAVLDIFSKVWMGLYLGSVFQYIDMIIQNVGVNWERKCKRLINTQISQRQLQTKMKFTCMKKLITIIAKITTVTINSHMFFVLSLYTYTLQRPFSYSAKSLISVYIISNIAYLEQGYLETNLHYFCRKN